MAWFSKSVFGRNNSVLNHAIQLSTEVEPVAPQFNADIPASFFGLQSYTPSVAPVGPVTRRQAIQVPAVKRAADIIAGTLGSLPLYYVDPDGTNSQTPLFTQPEANVPRSVTMTRTFEDLLFYGVSWWQVVARDWRGYPTKVVRLEPTWVSVTQQSQVMVTREGNTGVAVQWLQDGDYIQFQTGSDGWLVAGARAIRTALELDDAAALYASGRQPNDYFTPTGGVDPADDEDISTLLAAWNLARKNGSTAYIPAALDYHANGWNPEQLQLSDARQHAVLEISRLTGVDAEDLGVSTTSRSYFNGQDRVKAQINSTFAPYMRAVEDRLAMQDVTPRGYTAAFDLTDLLKADDATRMSVATQGLAANIFDLPTAQAFFGTNVTDTPDGSDMDTNNVITASFSEDANAQTFSFAAVDFTVDTEARTISGLAVPFGVNGVPGNGGGHTFQFGKGNLQWSDPSRVKVVMDHDWKQAVGRAVDLSETDAGLHGTFKIAKTPEGDRALALAKDKVYDGFSIEAVGNYKADDDGIVRPDGPVRLTHVALVPNPAFDSARVMSVAASAVDTKVEEMPDEITAEAPQTVDASADYAQIIKDGLKAGFEAMAAEHAKPVPVPAAPVAVTESLPYRFDGKAAQYDFSTDLCSAIRFNNTEARQRIDGFFAQFAATDSTDVSALNPNGYRPDLYVAPAAVKTPIADSILRGALTNGVPFVVPMFGSSSGLVNPHTEGTEPTDGTFTATSQTVTPSALSGKVEITREVIDAGGSPQVSGLIWTEIQRQWDIAKENAAAAVLAGFTTELGTAIAAGDVDSVLAEALTGNLAGLAFSNYTFTTVAAHVDLYQKLIGAKDGSNRPLFAQVAPQNANGTAAARYASINVAGYDFTPAGALGATGVNSRSYIFDPSGVGFWMSAPMQITLPDTVATAGNIGLFGYKAGVILDANRGYKITYTLS